MPSSFTIQGKSEAVEKPKPLGKIISRSQCEACQGRGFRSNNTSLRDGIAGDFSRCRCDGGYIYVRQEIKS